MLPVQRWRADPPLAGVPARPASPADRTRHPRDEFAPVYDGPPSYGWNHPRWGFPQVIWRLATTAGAPHTGSGAAAAFRPTKASIVLCAGTSLLAAAAGAGEVWRYVLLLRGRTRVLSGSLVRASDRFVDTAGTAALLAAVVTAAVLIPQLVRLHGGAARRAGLAPNRAPAAVLARLVIPGWNVYGMGVIAGEIDGLLPATDRRRARLSRLVTALWLTWAANAVLVVVALVRAFGTSDQAVADTVELHIFVDLMGAVVAGLWVLLLLRWRRVLAGRPRPSPDSRWVVRPPEPTRAAR